MDVIDIDNIGFKRFEEKAAAKKNEKKTEATKQEDKKKEKELKKAEKKADEANKPRKGFFIPQKIAIVGAVVIVAILVSAILITYFAKPNNCPKYESCQDQVCRNSTLTQSRKIIFHSILI